MYKNIKYLVHLNTRLHHIKLGKFGHKYIKGSTALVYIKM